MGSYKYLNVYYADSSEGEWTHIIATDLHTAENILFYALKDDFDYEGDKPIKLGQLKKIILENWSIRKCSNILYKGNTQGLKPLLSDKSFSFKFP